MWYAARANACAALLLLVACGSAHLETRASAGGRAERAAAGAGSPASGATGVARDSTSSGGAASVPLQQLPEPPLYDPALVRQAIDRSAEAPLDGRERLGLRLAVLDQGPDQPWFAVVVNRGTQTVRVVFDLRTLSLEITAPEPPAPLSSKRGLKKALKPLRCALPKAMTPSIADAELEEILEPGEGLVDSFDPRLYCPPTDGATPLVPGATLAARLGFPEKTKTVWRRGKSERVPLEQVPPFLARFANEVKPLPVPGEPQAAAAPRALPQPASEVEPVVLHSDSWGIKELLAPSVLLGAEYAPIESVPAHAEPLQLLLTRGSDARTEREATITVALVNRGTRSERVYFRRELLNFEISGPSGFVTCAPVPNSQVPDKQSFSTLAPGGRIAATSRLIEMCPAGALRAPGLYLVQARFEPSEAALMTGLQSSAGRLTTARPARVRVSNGWGTLPPYRAPQRVRVGSP